MRRVIFNEKGGVGKSSITCNLAAISASRGKRTLVVDLDSQCNSTHYLLGDSPEENTVADYFDGTLEFSSKLNEPWTMSMKPLRKSLCTALQRQSAGP